MILCYAKDTIRSIFWIYGLKWEQKHWSYSFALFIFEAMLTRSECRNWMWFLTYIYSSFVHFTLSGDISFIFFTPSGDIYKFLSNTSNSFPDMKIFFFNHFSVLNSNCVLVWSCCEIEIVILYFLQMIKLSYREIKSPCCRELSGMSFSIIETAWFVGHKAASRQRNDAWNSFLQ